MKSRQLKRLLRNRVRCRRTRRLSVERLEQRVVLDADPLVDPSVIIAHGSSISEQYLQAGYLFSDSGIMYVSFDSAMPSEQVNWWQEVLADVDQSIEPEFAIVPASSSLSQVTIYQVEDDYTSFGSSGVYIPPSALIYGDGTVERTSEARIELAQSVFSHSIRFAESDEAGWKSAAYHELGHALGLEHPHDSDDGDVDAEIDTNVTVMSYNNVVDEDGDPGFTSLDVQALVSIHMAESGATAAPVEGTLLSDHGPFDLSQTWKTPSLRMEWLDGAVVQEPRSGNATKTLQLTRYDGYTGNPATVFLDWPHGSGVNWHWGNDLSPSPGFHDISFGESYPSQIDFAADQTTATVEVTVIGDTVEEGAEWLDVTAREARTPGYFQAFPTETLRLTISDNDPPTLDFINDVFSYAGESQQTISLTGITAGLNESHELRVTAVSSDTSLISDLTVAYLSPDSTGVLSLTSAADQYGAASITVTVEDAGFDGLFGTVDDSVATTQTFDVSLLELLPYEGVLPLSQNAAGSLFVDKEPVFIGAENGKVNIRGFQVLGADDAGAQKSLLVRRDNHVGNSVRCRVLADDVWRISSIFDSLTNEIKQGMDASVRDVVYEFPESVLPGTTLGNLAEQYETSGLTWHDGLQKLFAVSDEGIVSMMNADGSDIVNWNVPGDLEALTVADHSSTLIYIGVENPDSILEFDVTTGQVTRAFDLTNWMTGADNQGLEALAFVPDATHPEGGFFYAGLQSDGRIYQFTSPIVSSSSSTEVTFVQSMAIEGGSPDLAGLAYDPSSELLLAMFDSSDQLNVIDQDGQLRSRWTVPGAGQEAVVFVDGQFYVGDDSLFSITLYSGFDLLTA